MTSVECSICFEKLGKIYKELPCGHRYHFGCITICEKLKKNKNLNCPYCRQEYSVMKLRKRIIKLTEEEKLKKRNLSEYIKSKLEQTDATKSLNKKVSYINKLYSHLIINFDILKDQKYNYTKFLEDVTKKLLFILNLQLSIIMMKIKFLKNNIIYL